MTEDSQTEFYSTKKQIAIQIGKRILLEEKQKGNIYVPILDDEKMEEAVRFSLDTVEKLTSLTKGDNLYELLYDTIVRKIMEQISYCGPFYPQKKTLDLGKFTVTSTKEISAILAQNVIDVVELTTGYLITERVDGNLLVPADISDDDIMGLVVEIIKNREMLKTLTNGTSVFEQNQQLLMNAIIEQILDYIPTITPQTAEIHVFGEKAIDTDEKPDETTDIAEEKTPDIEVKSIHEKKKSRKGKSPIRRVFGFLASRVSRRH